MPELLARPKRLLDREREWAMLSEFVQGPEAELRVAIVSGRCRTGKMFLLEALIEVRRPSTKSTS